MKKRIAVTLSLLASLFLAGCGGDTDTTCRMDVQTAIDKGDFNTAVNKLEGECADAYEPSDRYYSLGIAYMGKSGFGLTDVLTMILQSNNEGGDAFSALTRDVSRFAADDAIPSLMKAQDYLQKAIGENVSCASLIGNVDTRVLNACFYLGFNGTLLTSNTITKLTGDVDRLLSAVESGNTTEVPLDMKATLDAMKWALGSAPVNGSTITAQTVAIKGVAFKHLQVVNSGSTFYRLATSDSPNATQGTTVLTEGYCDANGDKTPCEGIENADGSINVASPNAATCYACPLMYGDQPVTTTDALVESLNAGLDSITAVTALTGDAEVASSIDDYKQAIDNGDGTITTDELINYLNAQ